MQDYSNSGNCREHLARYETRAATIDMLERYESAYRQEAMKARTGVSIAFLLALSLATTRGALALNLADYEALLRSDTGRSQARTYLDGVGAGIATYAIEDTLDGRPKRFCFHGQSLRGELLAGLIDVTLMDRPQLRKDAGRMPVETVVWIGLEKQFPCR